MRMLALLVVAGTLLQTVPNLATGTDNSVTQQVEVTFHIDSCVKYLKHQHRQDEQLFYKFLRRY